jgi:N,N'-diacetyllegionaminate synthase
MRTYVIGEAAACHDGEYYKALQLIGLAKAIDADAVKFQWCSSPQRLAVRRNAPEYVESYRLLNFPVEWFEPLKIEAAKFELDFLCTVYLPEDVAVVAPYVDKFKVSSFEAGDLDFRDAHLPYGKEIIVSAGMARRATWGNRVLHCVSAYPTPVEEINLSLLRYAEEFDGLSDHTQHPLTGAFAVCAGAEIIEFHFRLQQTSPGNPDYVVARDPLAAKQYVQNIRLAERMMGSGERKVQPSEEPNLKYRVNANG